MDCGSGQICGSLSITETSCHALIEATDGPVEISVISAGRESFYNVSSQLFQLTNVPNRGDLKYEDHLWIPFGSDIIFKDETCCTIKQQSPGISSYYICNKYIFSVSYLLIFRYYL